MASRRNLGKHLARSKSQVSGVNQSLITLPTHNPTPPQPKREKKDHKTHTQKVKVDQGRIHFLWPRKEYESVDERGNKGRVNVYGKRKQRRCGECIK